MGGTLYVVGGAIGNREDITLRALRTLKQVDMIAAEDTRHSLKLLSLYDIHTPLQSYHAHSSRKKELDLVSLILQGKNVALLSDAGMPGVSDPGAGLIRLCVDAGIPVVPIPGPTAAATAVSLAAVGTGEYVFVGFLPSTGKDRRRKIKTLSNDPRTLVFYEAPHRILETLRDLIENFGPRPAVLCREMTKIHEETLRGNLDWILAQLGSRDEVKGEITLVVQGARDPDKTSPSVDIETACARLASKPGAAGISNRDLRDLLSTIFDCPRNRASRALAQAGAETDSGNNNECV